jgi:hypothetical protein
MVLEKITEAGRSRTEARRELPRDGHATFTYTFTATKPVSGLGMFFEVILAHPMSTVCFGNVTLTAN